MQSRWPFALGFVFCLLTLPSLAEPLPSSSPEAAGLSTERLSHIGKFLKDDAGKGKLPGSVIAIARRGKLVYFEAAGFQDKPAGKIMKKDAIFRIYSMTKPWTSVAAMILVEEGRIQLTDPVSKYLPALKDLKVAIKDANGQSVVPAAHEPAIQDLLRHTSGFAYDFLTANPAVKEAYRSVGLKALGRDIRDKMTAPEFIGNCRGLSPLCADAAQQWPAGRGTNSLADLGRADDLGSAQARHAFDRFLADGTGRIASGDARVHFRARFYGPARSRERSGSGFGRGIHVGRRRR
ncbi:MAG: serine hydrolase domain-containing protein, partial [Rhodomicrobium sp.]